MPPPLLDSKSGCWIWQGSVVNGYGKLGYKGIPKWAHRAYYEYVYGSTPKRHQVHHRCENKLCVNPEHLEALSPRKHAQKGSRAKLTLIQVREIRRRLAQGAKGAHLAREYGVTHNAICDIRSGRSWQQDVTCPNCSHEFDPFEFD